MSEKTMYGVTAAGNQLIAAGNQSNVYIYIYIKKKRKEFFWDVTSKRRYIRLSRLSLGILSKVMVRLGGTISPLELWRVNYRVVTANCICGVVLYKVLCHVISPYRHSTRFKPMSSGLALLATVGPCIRH